MIPGTSVVTVTLVFHLSRAQCGTKCCAADPGSPQATLQARACGGPGSAVHHFAPSALRAAPHPGHEVKDSESYVRDGTLDHFPAPAPPVALPTVPAWAPPPELQI